MTRYAILAFIAVCLAGCGGAKAEAEDGTGAKSQEKAEKLGAVDDVSRCEVGEGRRESLVDLNQDEVADVRKVYQKIATGETLVCREADLNFDGVKDIFYFFDLETRPKRDEVDLDFDGSIDIITIYDNGKVAKQELDTNSDGMVDRVRFLQDGVPTRMEGDTDGDGRVDYWEYYEAGRVLRVGMDTDGDGRADNWSRDDAAEAGEEEEEEEEGEGEEGDEEEGEGEEGEGEDL